jgi:hypothetical protein
MHPLNTSFPVVSLVPRCEFGVWTADQPADVLSTAGAVTAFDG